MAEEVAKSQFARPVGFVMKKDSQNVKERLSGHRETIPKASEHDLQKAHGPDLQGIRSPTPETDTPIAKARSRFPNPREAIPKAQRLTSQGMLIFFSK